MTILNGIVTVLIALFAYWVSSDVRDIQKQADERAQAKEVHEFWTQINGVGAKADEQSGKFGDALAKFVIGSTRVMEEYIRIYQSGSFEAMDYDPKFLGTYTAFMGTYSEASTTILSVGSQYKFLRIQYSPLATTHNVTGWALFTNQDKAVDDWMNDAKGKVDRIAHTINDTILMRKDPSLIVAQINQEFSQLGNYLVTRPIPYSVGLNQFLDTNWKSQMGNVKTQ